MEKVAIENKMKLSDVQDEYHKYWKAVKNELQKSEDMRVIVPFFGSFQIVPKKLKRNIRHWSKKIEVLDTKDKNIRTINIQNDYLKKLKQLCNLYKNISTEDSEVCQICNKWLQETTTPS